MRNNITAGAGRAIWLLIFIASATAVLAQDEHAIPILSGTTAFITSVDAGQTVVQPTFAPVLLVPIKDKWLIEGRGEFAGEFEQQQDGSFSGPVESELQYLQLDYITNKYATISTGRYLTPFGIYNERLYPLFIRNLQEEPFTLGLVGESSIGSMVRGGFELTHRVNLTYAAYFSTLSTINKLESDRAAGGRVSFYFPKRRFEIGASLQHYLQEDRTNTYGTHLAWQPNSVPLDVRAEYAYADRGKAYWIESAYRLSSLPVAQNFARHVQLVARVQQFFLGKDHYENEKYELPDVQTNQAEGGVNYYFRDDIRVQASYGRSLSEDWNHNVWTVGATYRFAMPLWKGSWQ